LMREMPVSKASGLIGECDQRMWRILFAHVDEAYSKLDMSDVVSEIFDYHAVDVC